MIRKLIYQTINKLGYNIYNKNNKAKEIKNKLEKYNILHHKKLLYSCSKYLFIFEKNFEDFKVKESEKGLEVSFLNLIFDIDSAEEFLILTEVFIDKEYRFICNEDCIVIDIGANVGFSSIYFSQINEVQKIYSFEPVKDTFIIAEKNIKRNEVIKIAQFNNFGLGNLEREEQFLFKNNAKGNCGIRGNLSPSYQGEEVYEKRTVLIKSASDILEPIFKENKDLKIVMKMDCEGSEYEIFENLYSSFILKSVHIIILEWHDLGAEIIENYLKNSNFTIFSRRLSSISGMIYAVNNLRE